MRLRSGARVIDRGGGALQVGSRRAALFERPTAGERRFLERLDLAREVSQRDAAAHPELMEALRAADLFEQATPPVGTVGFDRAGALAVAIGTVLATEGWAVRFDDERPSAGFAQDYGSKTSASTRQSAAAAAVRWHVPAAVTRTGQGLADAWVIASEGAPRLDAAVRLMVADTPHVFAVTTERGVEVGPLVVPGVTACGMCHGIARAEEDPAWPIVALGLSAPSPSVPLLAKPVVTTAAGLVASALASLWRGAEPRWTGRWWDIAADGWVDASRVAARADCGCGAAGPIGDDVTARRTRLAAWS